MTTFSPFRLRSLVTVLLMAIATGTIGSCTPSKISQCNTLANTVNKMRPITEQFQQQNQTFEAAVKTASARSDFNGVKVAAADAATGFTTATKKLDELIQDIRNVTLRDETLVNLQTRYVENATAINAAFKDISGTLTTISQLENSPKGLKQLNTAGKTLSTTATKMTNLIQADTRLVSDFNTYCEVKP